MEKFLNLINLSRKSLEFLLLMLPLIFFVVLDVLFVLHYSRRVYLSKVDPDYVLNLHGGVTIAKTYWGEKIKFKGRVYPNSLSAHPVAKKIGIIQYKLNKISIFGFDRFKTKIGLTGTSNGEVKFSVGIDGVEIPETKKIITGSMKPRKIDIPIRNASTLELYIDPRGDNYSDHAVWVNAGIVRTKINIFIIIAFILQTTGYLLFVILVKKGIIGITSFSDKKDVKTTLSVIGFAVLCFIVYIQIERILTFINNTIMGSLY